MEVIGRVVLLIPSEIKRLKEIGRKEGRVEGRKEGREEERRRILDQVARLGDEVPTEVLEILKGDSNVNISTDESD